MPICIWNMGSGDRTSCWYSKHLTDRVIFPASNLCSYARILTLSWIWHKSVWQARHDHNLRIKYEPPSTPYWAYVECSVPHWWCYFGRIWKIRSLEDYILDGTLTLATSCLTWGFQVCTSMPGFLCGTGDRTKDCVHVRLAHYQESHISRAPFQQFQSHK